MTLSDLPTIGICGLTHLGLCTAAACAAKGFETVAYDSDDQRVEAIRAGRLSIEEPGLPEALRHPNLKLSSALHDIAQCDVVFVAEDVPTLEDDTSDLNPIRTLAEHVFPHLKPGAIMVILSQVPPGFTRGLARDLGGENIGYQVETLIFGRAMARALHPERLIVGQLDTDRPLPNAYQAYLQTFDCPVLAMRAESAELTKIAINAFLVSSLSTTGMLADLAAETGAQWSEIVPALRLDARIGPSAYLTPGLGFGGGNLGRDIATIEKLAGEHAVESGLTTCWTRASAYRRGWALRQVHSAGLEADAPVAILGLAYKENTASIRNSPGVELLRNLGPRLVSAHDPVVSAIPDPPERLTICATVEAACQSTAAVAIMTPWPDYATITVDQLAGWTQARLLLDPYGLLDERAFARAGFDYRRLGHPSGS